MTYIFRFKEVPKSMPIRETKALVKNLTHIRDKASNRLVIDELNYIINRYEEFLEGYYEEEKGLGNYSTSST